MATTTEENLDLTRRQIEAFRRTKDKWMQNSPDSPLDEEQRHSYTGLDYFPIDFDYRVKARMVLDPAPDIIRIQTTKGEWREYDLFGTLYFTLNGEDLSLQVFQPKGDKAQKGGKELFVPFRDKTAPQETYGAGRYLDLAVRPEGEEYILDFNRAYNPWCAYSPNYSCTMPPRQNQLAVRVPAGEKNYPDHDVE